MNHQIAALLKTLDKSREEFWNIGEDVGQFLNILIKTENIQSILEIGTSNGYSGIWFAEALKETGGTLYTIESHKARFKLAQENFKTSGLTNHIHQINGHAPEDLPSEPAQFDLAFFDATKYEHIDYFHALKPRIKPQGFIIADNVLSHKEDMKDFLDKIKAEKNWFSIELNLGQGILISQNIQPS